MRPSIKNTSARTLSASGFTLIECLMYIALLAVILGIGSLAFYHVWDSNKALSRNSDDIVRALQAGEMWRADIRQATGPVKITKTNSVETLRIPCRNKEFLYSFSNGEMHRKAPGSRIWETILTRVQSSRMQLDQREGVTAWRWELALQTYRKHAKVHPLFTFEAAAGTPLSQ